jgi:hypothetical protein
MIESRVSWIWINHSGQLPKIECNRTICLMELKNCGTKWGKLIVDIDWLTRDKTGGQQKFEFFKKLFFDAYSQRCGYGKNDGTWSRKFELILPEAFSSVNYIFQYYFFCLLVSVHLRCLSLGQIGQQIVECGDRLCFFFCLFPISIAFFCWVNFLCIQIVPISPACQSLPTPFPSKPISMAHYFTEI